MAGDLKDKVAFCVGIGARVGEIGELVVEPEGGRESLRFRGPRKGQELGKADEGIPRFLSRVTWQKLASKAQQASEPTTV